MENSVLIRSEVTIPYRRSRSIPISGESPRGLRSFRQWCFYGKLVKGSYSAAKTPSRDAELASHHLLLTHKSYKDLGISRELPRTSIRTGYVLDSHDDEYDGVVVNPERLPHDADNFGFTLRMSLSYWKSKKKKGVWLKLPLDLSKLVPVAVKEGFKYHHAEEEYLMLTYWIPDEPSLLPANASHQVGVGGFVINENNEILVVQEKYCSTASSGVWKLPTGFINESEEIFDGAVREVKEETGIESEFLEVIAFRHVHCMAFKKSDLFFICMLRPLSTQIKIDGLEIEAAKWMPLVEFIKQPLIQADDMFRKITEICIARLGKRYCGLVAHRLTSKFDERSSSLYYNVTEFQDSNCQGLCDHLYPFLWLLHLLCNLF